MLVYRFTELLQIKPAMFEQPTTKTPTVRISRKR